MSIEDLIRAANPVRTSDLPEGDSPHARLALVQIMGPRTVGDRMRLSRRAWKGTLSTLAVMAAGAAVALAVSAAPSGAPHRTVTAGAGRTVPRAARTHHPAAHAAAHPLTARQILLLAAEHVTAGPASGAYWRVSLVSGLTFPAGTKSDPYDISLMTSADQWNPSQSGQREWVISQQLGARPATPADAAAWRAAGSPTTWHSGMSVADKAGWQAGYPLPWMLNLAASTAASARTATWQVSDGTVGYVEGDLPGLNAAQFRAMPTSRRAVAQVLRHYYAQLRFCAQNPGRCSTKDQIIWAEALMLLQDPVSPQVRAATFRVMASLPGVRLLGLMTDPLGRTGYALAPGGQAPNPAPENFNPLHVVLIDPQTGSVLATEEIGPMPRTVHCLSWDSHNHCAGSAYVGRSYPDQVDSYVAVVSEGWTNAAPTLPPPSAWSGPTGFPGLPPLP
jgi:hypothetical protein